MSDPVSNPYGAYVEQEAKTALYANQVHHDDPVVQQRISEMLGGSYIPPKEIASSSSSSSGDVAGNLVLMIIFAIIGVFFFVDGLTYIALATLVALLMIWIPTIGFSFYGLAWSGLFAGLASAAPPWKQDYWMWLSVPLAAVAVLGLIHAKFRWWHSYRMFNSAARLIYLYGLIIWGAMWMAGRLPLIENLPKILAASKFNLTNAVFIAAGPFSTAVVWPYRLATASVPPNTTLMPYLAATAVMAAILLYVYRGRVRGLFAARGRIQRGTPPSPSPGRIPLRR